MPPHPLHDPLFLSAPPSVSSALLEKALRQDWGLEGALHPLGGERDRNFRLDRDGAPSLLVKLTHPDEDAAVTDFQIAALLHLAEADPTLPVPRVLRARSSATALPHPTLEGRTSLLRVLSYVPGQPIGEAGASTPLGAATARLDRALQDFRHPAEGRRLLWDIREAPALRAWLPVVRDSALRTLAGAALDRCEQSLSALARLPRQVIHNDLNPHNVLMDERGAIAGIIDFGDLVHAPLLQEVATTASYLIRPGAAPMEAVHQFLDAYRAVMPLPEEQLSHLPALAAARMAMTVLITHWRAARQPENAAYILRNMPRAHAGLETLASLQG